MEESILARHHPVGVSTGYMEEVRSDWPAQVAEATMMSAFAVELSALSEKQLAPLHEFLSSGPSLPFRYLSIHGPSKDRQMDEDELVAELHELAEWADGIVMHPDTIEEPTLYRTLGRTLLLENMDARKNWGRTRDELADAFAELPEAGFCFDIAHAWSVDEGMSVAGGLLDGFGDRLRHVHISSLSSELHHVPLTREDEDLFRPVLERCVDVPWILEAPPRAD
jgi:Xylose isomerase-like TIM barrel